MQYARLTDLWFGKCDICGCTMGPIVTGSLDTFENNLKCARIYDITVCLCYGHTGVIVQGSLDTLVNNRVEARTTDAVSAGNSGIIISGSPNTMNN